MLIDGHTHIGRLHGWRWEAELLLASADEIGADVVLCSHLASIFYSLDDGNRELGEAMRDHPGRLLGYVAIPSGRLGPAAVEAIDRYVGEYGMVGVKIYSTPRAKARPERLLSVAEPGMLPVVEHTATLHLPVLAHATPDESAWLAERVPEATIVMAHMGGTAIAEGDWVRAIDAAAAWPNVYLDTASSTVDAGMLELAIEAIGAERILFGTDTPLLDPHAQLARVIGADLTDSDRALILGENLARLLGLGERP
ncbi:MAG: amidohydrolase family protein [Chloroflexi bacterium]|nr:amidohydrolase family protein [Chloroflexota bacterium]